MPLRTRQIFSKKEMYCMKKLFKAIGKSIAETCVDIAYTYFIL